MLDPESVAEINDTLWDFNHRRRLLVSRVGVRRLYLIMWGFGFLRDFAS